MKTRDQMRSLLTELKRDWTSTPDVALNGQSNVEDKNKIARWIDDLTKALQSGEVKVSGESELLDWITGKSDTLDIYLEDD